MDDLILLVQSPAIMPILIVVALLFVERMWQIPERLQPLLFIKLLGVRMAEKVNAQAVAESTQNTILSGALAALLLTVPWLLILYFMNQFAYYPVFFDALLLFFCLQFSHYLKRYKHIQKALRLNKMKLSKDMLAKIVLRDTQPLSSIGVSKAAAETLQLRFYYQQITVIFWFVIAGPFAALFYRMSLELSFTWNTKLPAFAQFGVAIKTICHYMQWIPIRIASACAILVTRGLAPLFSANWQSLPAIVFGPNGRVILAAQSIATRLHLSGAVMYAGQKRRRGKFIGIREPEFTDMDIIIASINRTLFVYVAMMLVIKSLVIMAIQIS